MTRRLKGIRRKAVLAIALLALVALGSCNTLTTALVRHTDKSARREAGAAVLEGAHARTLGPEDAQGAVLLVHGFAGAPTDFAHLPGELAEAGWRVRMPLLPGHGTSPFDLEKVTADELEAAVLSEYDRLADEHGCVVVGGHSMGAALATLVAAKRPAAGLISGGGYYGITRRWYYVLPPETWISIAKPVLRWVYKGEVFTQVNRKEAKKHIIAYTWLPVRGFGMLRSIGATVTRPDTLEKVTCPVLMLHGPGDAAASFGAAKKAFGQMASAGKRFVVLDRSNHHVFWDYDRDQVVREVRTFLDSIEAENREPSG